MQVWQLLYSGKFWRELSLANCYILVIGGFYLIWQICGHVPLSMRIMTQNGGFYFGEWISKRQI